MGIVVVLIALAALIAAGTLYQHVEARRRASRFRPPGEMVDVGGHRVHTWCSGAGSPLVLLESGIAASSLSWSLVQPKVSEFARVCAYDRAGLAWSEAASCARTFRQIVAELSRVLDQVAPAGPVVLVGHSFGTFVVRAYAEQHPDRIAGLVLVDPPTEWLTVTPHRRRMLRGGRHLSRLGGLLARVGVVRACLALLTGGVPAAPRGFVNVFGPTAAATLSRLVGEVRKLPPAVHPVVQELWCQPKCFRSMADHLAVLEREAAALGTISTPSEIPVAVISSGNQPVAHLDEHRRLAEQSRAGRHLVAARSSHWVQFDEPELIVEAVRDLVRRRQQ